MRIVPIPFAKRSRRNVVRQTSRDGASVKRSTRVRLRPRADWHKRNFLTSVLIPSLFVKRASGPAAPQFPKIREGEICITWIGHASFLIQTHEVNILIDPIWSKWLKVIKRLKQPGFEIHHLPSIDFVLVTHAHFDHLDRRTLRRVAADKTNSIGWWQRLKRRIGRRCRLVNAPRRSDKLWSGRATNISLLRSTIGSNRRQ
ncbi:MAG: hypothetical protein DMF28_03780 [Verrucomicrobia bacterium]|nr:MAG: hypothetical protein DMF28_03780 [Verrucomicrobiota bacterium]